MTIGCSVTLLAEIQPIHWTTINQNKSACDKVIVARTRARAKEKSFRRQSQVQPAQAINQFGSGTV
ncbi:MAG: hypothetical protein DME91_01110 [Verrucomicrobia bacterium]|nr:MAG: hypothetical protein DME91_01110 [Verrucomicrobiota bacterium]